VVFLAEVSARHFYSGAAALGSSCFGTIGDGFAAVAVQY